MVIVRSVILLCPCALLISHQSGQHTVSYTAQEVIYALLNPSACSFALVSPDFFGPYLVEASTPVHLWRMGTKACHALVAQYPELAERKYYLTMKGYAC
jgi:hypothetical protein